MRLANVFHQFAALVVTPPPLVLLPLLTRPIDDFVFRWFVPAMATVFMAELIADRLVVTRPISRRHVRCRGHIGRA